MYSVEACNVINQRLNKLAERYKEIKFARILSDRAIRNYPDRNLPTILVYKDTEIWRQLIGLRACGGPSPSVQGL